MVSDLGHNWPLPVTPTQMSGDFGAEKSAEISPDCSFSLQLELQKATRGLPICRASAESGKPRKATDSPWPLFFMAWRDGVFFRTPGSCACLADLKIQTLSITIQLLLPHNVCSLEALGLVQRWFDHLDQAEAHILEQTS